MYLLLCLLNNLFFVSSFHSNIVLIYSNPVYAKVFCKYLASFLWLHAVSIDPFSFLFLYDRSCIDIFRIYASTDIKIDI